MTMTTKLAVPQTDADWRQVCDALSRLPTPGTEHMTHEERFDGVRVMLGDLKRLAERDGCVAAGQSLGLAAAVALRETGR